MNRCRRCAHSKDVHKHYRRGTDCGRCGCPAYLSLWGKLKKWFEDAEASL